MAVRYGDPYEFVGPFAPFYNDKLPERLNHLGQIGYMVEKSMSIRSHMAGRYSRCMMMREKLRMQAVEYEKQNENNAWTILFMFLSHKIIVLVSELKSKSLNSKQQKC